MSIRLVENSRADFQLSGFHPLKQGQKKGGAVSGPARDLGLDCCG
jgi:hypothetical protein